MFIYSRSPEKMKHNSHVLCPDKFHPSPPTPALHPPPTLITAQKKKNKQIKVATAIAYIQKRPAVPHLVTFADFFQA